MIAADHRGHLALAAAAATGIQVGAAMVATRLVANDIGPSSLALLRYAIGALFLLPFALIAHRRMQVIRQDLAPIAILGIVQFGALIVLMNYGLKFIPAARASLIFATFPLLTMLIAAAMGREPISPWKTAGVLLTILGLAVTLLEKLRGGGGSDEWLGAAAIFGSALCGAICSVLYRPYLQRNSASTVGALAMMASVAALLLPAWGEGLFDQAFELDERAGLAVLFIGLSSGIGYALWLWALSHATPTRVTVFLALGPVTALALGAMFLGEPVTIEATAGVALVSLGLACATRRDAKGAA